MNDIDSYILGHWSFRENCPSQCKVKVVKLSALNLDNKTKQNKLDINYIDTKLIGNKSKKSENNTDCYNSKLILTSENIKDISTFECRVVVKKLNDSILCSLGPKGELFNNIICSSKIKTNSFCNKTMAKFKGENKKQCKSFCNKSISNTKSECINSVAENAFCYGLRSAKSNANVPEDLSQSNPHYDNSNSEENYNALPRRSARLIKLLESSVAGSCNTLLLPKSSLEKSHKEVSNSNNKENNKHFKNRRKAKKIPRKLSTEHQIHIPISIAGKQKFKTHSRKPTLKYLKERDNKLQGNFCSRSDRDNDLFSSSFGDKYKNLGLQNFLQNDSEDMADYMTFLTPNGKLKDTTSTMTPRTNLLNEWGKSMKTPTTSITPQYMNKCNKDKQGALAVIFHHLRDKPKIRKKVKHTTQEKRVITKENIFEMPQLVRSILKEPHNANNDDDSLDEYFEEMD